MCRCQSLYLIPQASDLDCREGAGPERQLGQAAGEAIAEVLPSSAQEDVAVQAHGVAPIHMQLHPLPVCTSRQLSACCCLPRQVDTFVAAWQCVMVLSSSQLCSISNLCCNSDFKPVMTMKLK